MENKHRSYRLKLWLPLSSVVIFFCLLISLVWIDYHNALELTRQQAEQDIQATLKRLQMTLENDLAGRDDTNLERELSYIDLRSASELIALIDDRGMILAANPHNRQQKSARQVLLDFDNERFLQSRQTFHSNVRFDQDRLQFTAYAPVHLPDNQQTARSKRIGAFYYVYNHSYIEQAIWQQVVNNGVLIWTSVVLAFFLFWLKQHYFVTRPLTQLLLFTAKLGKNDLAAKNPLTGSGELMQLGQMLEQTSQSLQNTLATLKQREENLAITLQSIGNGVITTDTDGLITRMNPIAEQLTGWRSSVAIGQALEKVFNIIHTEAHEGMSSALQQVLETRRTVQQSNHIVLLSQNGSQYHIENNAAPILDASGKLYGVILVFNDVTDKYQLRDQIRHEQLYLQHILNNSATAIYTLTPNPRSARGFQFNYGSKRLEQLSGFALRDWQTIDDLWFSRIHADDRERVKRSNQEVLSKGQIKLSYRFLNADGYYRWIEDHLMALANEAGEIYELMGGWIDVTETMEAEQKNQQLGAILEQSVNEIQIFNSKTLHFEHVNQGGINNLGYSLAELKDMTALDIKPEYDVESYLQLLGPLLRGEQSRLQFDTVNQRKDGTRYPVTVWLQIYRNGSEYFVAIELDLTQRKAHEDKINRLSNFYASLSKINHAIVHINNEDDLFAKVCHIAVKIDNIAMAWVGKPDADAQYIVPVAAAGEKQDYLHALTISMHAHKPEGLGPTGLAYRENRIVAVNDFQSDTRTAPWRDKAGRHDGWKASCAIPISLRQQPYAVLNVYSNQQDFFDSEVLSLLEELSFDLSFALDSYAHETARRNAEEKLELSARVFNQSQEGILISDKDNRVVSVNQAFTRITGYDEQEILGKNPNFLASGQQNKDFYRAMWKSLIETDFWQGELWDRNKEGNVYAEWLTISVVRNEAGNIINYIAIFTDITQHKAAKQQIEHLAHYDALTNLPNRLLLKARVDHEITVAERRKQSFALLFIDLDHFKNINDALGHSIGDYVLIEVSRRLLSAVREDDTVARIGGDEFNIMLADTHWHGAAIVAKKIISLLAEPVYYQHYQLHITPSIGISLYPENGDNYETLTKNADTALYQAKNQGRNQYQFFTQAMQQQTHRRMEIESRLRHALELNELIVYFQPQINTQTHRINGGEALLRWRHPDWGMVAPSEFIPVAEECGLILSIGDWVLKQSIAQAKQWHDAGFPLTISVNLSLAQFRANTLCGKVKQTLEYYDFPPQYLELELTESIAMQNVDAAIEITRQLTELGIVLAIDDFGTGYSSLSYLQRFSLHKLKIDQSFTKEMETNKESENIVNAIISLAKSLNLKTIAEGVETEQQLSMFKQKNCDEIQGYYFSKPLPADEFTELLVKGFI